MATQSAQLDAIEPYLSRLGAALTNAPRDERDDFLREIRAHILDRMQEGADVNAVLAGLGSAEQLASDFRAETALAHSSQSWSALVLLRTAARWALSGAQGFAIFVVALTGYGLATTFYLTAALKPIYPDHIGVFVGDGNLNIGFNTNSQARDISGPYYTLYAMVLGFLLVALTTLALRAMMRKFAAARRRLGPPSGGGGSIQIPQIPSAMAIRDSVRNWSPWKLLRTAARWALTGVSGFAAFLVGSIGYVMGGTFYLTAILKPIYPTHIGIFVGGDAGFQIANWPAPNGHDIAGPYFTVIAILAGFLLTAATTALLRQMMVKVAAAKRLLA